MSIEVRDVKVGRWYQTLSGQYRQVLNLDSGGMVTYKLVDHHTTLSNRLRASVQAFAVAVDRETDAPVLAEEFA